MAAPLEPVVEAPRLVPLAEPWRMRVVTRERPLAAQVVLALWRALWRRRRLPPPGGVRGQVATRELVSVEAARVAAFRDVCGHGPGDSVPTAFPEILFHPLVVEIALARDFPFSPLGLVHVRQQIRQVRPLEPGERLDLRCTLAEIRSTGRGYEVDCSMVVHAAGGVAWEGVSTLLARMRGRSGPRGVRPTADPFEADRSVEVEVLADTGRRYAAVSGDWNPHHVSRMAARLLGFQAPIAHGMWTLARSLAAADAWRPLAEACTVDAVFRRPVLLPSRIVLKIGEAPGGGIRLEARDPASGVPHLAAEVTRAG
ncbi:MAG: hypothetical protein JXB39_05630 [Deltaproteobacteria bacterium]|nr:hypothetical protein [Deltaproteobacteria bacterium]